MKPNSPDLLWGSGVANCSHSVAKLLWTNSHEEGIFPPSLSISLSRSLSLSVSLSLSLSLFLVAFLVTSFERLPFCCHIETIVVPSEYTLSFVGRSSNESRSTRLTRGKQAQLFKRPPLKRRQRKYNITVRKAGRPSASRDHLAPLTRQLCHKGVTIRETSSVDATSEDVLHTTPHISCRGGTGRRMPWFEGGPTMLHFSSRTHTNTHTQTHTHTHTHT